MIPNRWIGAGLQRLLGPLRRPELMVFVTALTLAAFWVGGERSLIVVALGAPLLFAMAGAFRFSSGGPMLLTDVLTGIALRPQIIGVMDKILGEGPDSGMTTACAVVQFDDMEDLVDRHGRAAQTEILTRCAERMCSVLRAGDTVARLEGADLPWPSVRCGGWIWKSPYNFVPAAIGADGPDQPEWRKALRHRLHRVLHGREVAAAQRQRPSGRGPGRGDEALRNGPAAIRAYAPDMTRTRADRDALREELETALDEGQIRAHFQPQVSTDTGAISGFEALARWHHPSRGLVAPADFLPAIEDCGLSSRLGEVMVYNALMAISRWDKAGFKVPTVAVNFSKSELRSPGLASKLKWELDRFNLSSDRLTIEILETVVADTDNDVIVSNIAAIAQMGCGVDLDDFGTGHASITSIRRFQIRRIKIDRSFVTRVDEDREQQKIVSAVLSMAERLGMETLAEGVETPGEHTMLAQLGCRHVQGFGIARPMPVEETMDWIGRHLARQTGTPRIGNRAR